MRSGFDLRSKGRCQLARLSETGAARLLTCPAGFAPSWGERPSCGRPGAWPVAASVYRPKRADATKPGLVERARHAGDRHGGLLRQQLVRRRARLIRSQGPLLLVAPGRPTVPCGSGWPRGALVNHECSGHHRSRPSRLVAQIRGIRLSLMMTPGVVQNACRCAPPAPPVVGVAACDAVGAAPGRSV
jgi:hypothetical protein